MSKEEFNKHVKPFSDSPDTAQLLMNFLSSRVDAIAYDPSRKPGVETAGHKRTVNTYRSPEIKSEEGDLTPWLEFMSHLFPDEIDRREVMRWCATLIALPEVKMSYGILLVSETQGVGKGTLGEKILAPLVGLDNASFPSETEIVDGQFNYWMAHKRLAVIHEIYAGHSLKTYNKLKSIITDKHISVNKKHLAAYRIDNWLHIFACSNHRKPLSIAAEDRRWLVPEVTDRKRDHTYWARLNAWLIHEDGLGIIKKWAIDYVGKEDGAVLTGVEAPDSKTKKRMIEESFSDGMRLVRELAEAAAKSKKPVMFTDIDARTWLAIKLNTDAEDLKESLYDVRKMLKAGGLRQVGKKKIHGSRKTVFINHVIDDWKNPPDETMKKPIEIMEACEEEYEEND